MLVVTQRRRFRVAGVTLFADVGIAQDAQPLGVGGHDAVFDTVVDHLDEVAGAVLATVQITQFGGTVELFASRGARNVASPRSEALDRVSLAPDHHAVATFQTPFSSSCAYLHNVHSFRPRCSCAPNVTLV